MSLTHACLCCVQPAVARMDGVLEDPARVQKLQSHLPWLEIMARLLRLPNSGQAAGNPMLASDPKVVEATSGKLMICKPLQFWYSVQVSRVESSIICCHRASERADGVYCLACRSPEGGLVWRRSCCRSAVMWDSWR